ncbi:electron transfer flavoprotein subunit alpha/FixB family protein [Desulfosudis oleivorans]|uniref:Electron transfer flavoprotein alpha subunit n=1 Tax=Desulfosudis oleivorans (strain DSM 6200 / JCM 39069 / Hxd3) TaxID=96561 RepID=A8ZSJ1_DESOH|nr:electron transfer flavoprotein subunit alpha/FixB family protein [Desulfosudis oleivorans]ABW67728.1 Electron transfer flavoprotein alpha subunit [Desulfosudis oleivorans Hxd3]
MNATLLLIAETIDNRVTGTSLEMTGLAQRLAPNMTAMFALAGSDIKTSAEKLAAGTGIPVTAFEGPDLAFPNPEILADLIGSLVEQTDAEIVCYPHTTCGCHAAARTAALMDAPCVPAVESVEKEGDALVFRRSVHNGRLKTTAIPRRRPVVLTLLPGAFKPAGPPAPSDSPPAMTLQKVEKKATGFSPVELTREASGDAALEHADIIVAVGRGIGDPENLGIVNDLARRLPNAAVAASRPLCDLQWLPYSRQVGATGRTVTPRLYIACGISGAQQHVYGMKDSQWIVAVNTDPHATIFSVAHIGVVEDLLTFLPLLAEAYDEMKKA